MLCCAHPRPDSRTGKPSRHSFPGNGVSTLSVLGVRSEDPTGGPNPPHHLGTHPKGKGGHSRLPPGFGGECPREALDVWGGSPGGPYFPRGTTQPLARSLAAPARPRGPIASGPTKQVRRRSGRALPGPASGRPLGPAHQGGRPTGTRAAGTFSCPGRLCGLPFGSLAQGPAPAGLGRLKWHS